MRALAFYTFMYLILQLIKVDCGSGGKLGVSACTKCSESAGDACRIGGNDGVCSDDEKCAGKKKISLDIDDKYKKQRNTINNREKYVTLRELISNPLLLANLFPLFPPSDIYCSHKKRDPQNYLSSFFYAFPRTSVLRLS